MKKEVIICQGIPASGKTTWARQYLQTNDDVAIVERDEIRESIQPGYYKGRPNKQVEKQVTKKAEHLLRLYLTDDFTETIIISDTNLNTDRLRSLEIYLHKFNENVVITKKVFQDSFNLQLCLDRNRKREKRVPEDVMCKFYRKFMHLHKPTFDVGDKQLIFVGDIHSQYENLEKLVNSLGDSDSIHYVFLGDINDSRLYDDEGMAVGDFMKCYYLIRRLVAVGKATLVHSNHQKNLISALRGRRKKASWGLKGTLDELEKAGFLKVTYERPYEIEKIVSTNEALDMAAWLDTRPYYFEQVLKSRVEFVEYNNNGYKEPVRFGNPPDTRVIGIHAQYLPKYFNSPYDGSGRGVEASIYGTRLQPGSDPSDRVRWWETYNQSTYVISGHYHHFYVGPCCAVIDSGCGQGGPLCAFNYTTKEVHLFEKDD